jgi:SNF2 family DNA or RNA helicase
VLTGSTRDRGRIVRRFNSEQHERVLLASLLAGGVGIDLTGASVVIHYDRWWNPAKENQATDRVHRIGQKRFVQVFKLVTLDTVEERVDDLIRSKLELMDRVVAPTEDVLRAFDRRELAALLGITVE